MRDKRDGFTIIGNPIIEDLTVSGGALLVYLGLCRHADREGRSFPSVARLATLARLSKRAVHGALAELLRTGYVEKTSRWKVSRKGLKSRDTSLYRITSKADPSAPGAPGVVHGVHQGGAPGALGVVHQVHSELDPYELDPLNQMEPPPATRNGETALYHDIKAAFELQYGDFEPGLHGKEGKAIKQLIAKATQRAGPEMAGDFLRTAVAKFWQLKQEGRRLFSDQPFLPSVLNSAGIWPRVLETMRGEAEPYLGKVEEEIPF